MGRVDGKVALITGAARGQGRSHAIRLAQEGADVVAIDICEEVGTTGYPMSTPEDLEETVRLVEHCGRRISAYQGDVRDPLRLAEIVTEAVGQFGHLDIVSANAGIADYDAAWKYSEERWKNIIDINLTGVWNTAKAVIPAMIEAERGGSIILTGSTAALKGMNGVAPYSSAKFGVMGLAQTLSLELAPYRIRVNSVHPTTVDTAMIHNDTIYQLFRPDIDGEVSREQFEEASARMHPMGVPMIEAIDISNAVLWLASDEARYVTGIALPVDAGAMRL
jgi:(+)-trans-carveol dehydrogenase